MKKLLLCFVSCIFLVACGNNSSDRPEIKKPGQSLFEDNCTSCHGSDGKLCVLGAKDLSVSTLTKDQMMEIISKGKNTMTPFGTMLSKEQIDAVADYVQTLRK